MNNNEYEQKIIIPHDTTLSEILEENRYILSKIRNIIPSEKVIPFYPPHCVLDTTEEINQLKKCINFIQIEPPAYENGFFYRPVTINGTKIGSFPIRIQKNENPTGILFGYFCNSENLSENILKKINQEIKNCNIKPLSLRVFRIHKVKYIAEENPDTISNFNWELSKANWVKLR